MPGGITTIISFITKYAGAGAEAAKNGIKGVSQMCSMAAKSTMSLVSSLGSSDSAMGKVAKSALTLFSSVQQMGAIGGIIAGAQMAIQMVSEYFIERANKMVEAIEEAGEKIRNRLDRLNKARMDGVTKALDEATTKAKEAASAFDALASSYLKVQSAVNATSASGANAEMASLNYDKAKAMSEAKDDNERALVGAGHDVRIAEANAKAVAQAQDNAVKAANDEAMIRAMQAKAAQDTEKKALAAREKATKIYEEDVATQNDGNVEKSKRAKEDAEKAYTEAVNDRIRKEAEAEAASSRATKAMNDRTAAITDARRGIIEAEEAERRLIDSQRKAAEAQREREKAEKAAAEAARKKAAIDEKRAALDEQRETKTSERDRWQSAFDSAFDLWRDPEAAARAVDADKQRSEDMKRFRKEVNRYGGQGKIDEAARLMREGDEEGLQSRLDQWRKSSKFTPQVEQMVKAAAADQNKNSAEKSLAEIEKNTANLDKKLDQLLALK